MMAPDQSKSLYESKLSSVARVLDTALFDDERPDIEAAFDAACRPGDGLVTELAGFHRHVTAELGSGSATPAYDCFRSAFVMAKEIGLGIITPMKERIEPGPLDAPETWVDRVWDTITSLSQEFLRLRDVAEPLKPGEHPFDTDDPPYQTMIEFAGRMESAEGSGLPTRAQQESALILFYRFVLQIKDAEKLYREVSAADRG